MTVMHVGFLYSFLPDAIDTVPTMRLYKIMFCAGRVLGVTV